MVGRLLKLPYEGRSSQRQPGWAYNLVLTRSRAHIDEPLLLIRTRPRNGSPVVSGSSRGCGISRRRPRASSAADLTVLSCGIRSGGYRLAAGSFSMTPFSLPTRGFPRSQANSANSAKSSVEAEIAVISRAHPSSSSTVCLIPALWRRRRLRRSGVLRPNGLSTRSARSSRRHPRGDVGDRGTLPRSLLKFSGGHSVFRLLPDRTLRV